MQLEDYDSSSSDAGHAITNLFDSMQIRDSMGNDHGRPKDMVGEVRQAFTSTADTAFDVCVDNQLVGRSKPLHAESTVAFELP